VAAALVELQQWSGSQFDPTMVDALVAAVTSQGWEPHVDLTEQIVDPRGLIVADHDDPAVHQPVIRRPAYDSRIERVS
jgi:hypothetical protein